MGDGTIRDNETGLRWLKDASCSALTGTDPAGLANWQNALAAAAALSYGTCGLTDGSATGDWRLPTKADWEAFYSLVYEDPALVNTGGDAIWSEGDAFTGVELYYYWSSTEYSSNLAWYAMMWTGVMDAEGGKFRPSYVWPVRSGN